MEDLFVPYELAVRLKDKGFNQVCIAYWNAYGEIVLSERSTQGLVFTSAPLWQQALDWLREEKGIIVHVEADDVSSFGFYKSVVYKLESQRLIPISYYNDRDYYSALQSGIEKALEII